MYYRMVAFFKGLRRRMLFKVFEKKIVCKKYGAGDKVGDWHGWVELNGECIAFMDKHGDFTFEW